MIEIKRLPLGVQLYTIREHTQTKSDLKKSLERIKEIGYDCVQLSAIGPIPPGDIADLLKNSGLECAATHVGWNRFKEDIDSIIKEHKLWKCRHTAIGMLPVDYYFEKNGLERFLEELAPISSRLAEEGIDFSYHNHHHEFTRHNGKLWLEMLYEKAPAEVLKAEIDTCWIQMGGGDPVEWINKCSGRQPLLHLKDLKIDISKDDWVQQKMAEIGEGNLDWHAILNAAQNSGVEYLLVEQDDCNGVDPFHALETSYKNLQKFMDVIVTEF